MAQALKHALLMYFVRVPVRTSRAKNRAFAHFFVIAVAVAIKSYCLAPILGQMALLHCLPQKFRIAHSPQSLWCVHVRVCVCVCCWCCFVSLYFQYKSVCALPSPSPLHSSISTCFVLLSCSDDRRNMILRVVVLLSALWAGADGVWDRCRTSHAPEKVKPHTF